MIYLLTLTIGPERHRLASTSLVVSSDSGGIYFDGGLVRMQLDRSAELGADTPDVVVPVELLPGSLDVGAILAAGHDIASARAEIARIPNASTTWENRTVLVEGRLSEPVYGGLGEPVAFSVRLIGSTTRVLIPEPLAVLQDDTWTTSIPAENEGSILPIVFGAPAYDAVLASNVGAGSPGYCVETPGLGKHICICAGPVNMAQVEVAAAVERTSRSYLTASVYWGKDYSGLPPHYSFVATPAGFSPDWPSKVWVRWTDDTGEGVRRPFSESSVQTAGELLEYLLWRHGDIDEKRTAAAVAQLPIRVDGYIDSRVDPLAWIRQNLLPLFPISIVRGPEGLYPIVQRPYLDPSAYSLSFSVARGEIYRSSPVTYDGSDRLVNDVSIRFSLDCGTRQYLKAVRHTGEASAELGETIGTSKAAQKSFVRFGTQAHEITTNVLYRPEAAYQVCSWIIRRYALPSRIASYDLPEAYAFLQPGEGIWLTDAEVGIDHLCVVERVGDPQSGQITIWIRTVEQ